MLTLGLDSYYFEMLRHLNLLQVLWPDHSLHASNYLGSVHASNYLDTPKSSTSNDTK